MKMKKALIVLPIVIAALALSACGGAEPEAEAGAAAVQETLPAAAEETAAEPESAAAEPEAKRGEAAEPAAPAVDGAALSYAELRQWSDDPQVVEAWKAAHGFFDAFEWQAVESSALSEAAYSWLWQALAVRFCSNPGAVYVYFDVPEYVFEELVAADSIGSYYNSYIKGSYECERFDQAG